MIDRVERLTNLLALLLETPRPLTLVEIAGELRRPVPRQGGQPAGGVRAGQGGAARASACRSRRSCSAASRPASAATGSTATATSSPTCTSSRTRCGRCRSPSPPSARVRRQIGRGGAVEARRRRASTASVRRSTATCPSCRRCRRCATPPARRATVDVRATAATPRRVDPYGLLLRDGFWYVVGRDHEHDELRTYRVDRIEGDVDVAGDGRRVRAAGRVRPARPRSRATRSSSAPATPSVVDAVVRVDGGAGRRRRARARQRARRAPPSPTARSTSRCRAPTSPAFRSWVLGLLDHAEVLGAAGRARRRRVDWLHARWRRRGVMASGGGRRTAEERLQPPARDAAVADGARRGAARRGRRRVPDDARPRSPPTSSWRRCAGCRRSSTR